MGRHQPPQSRSAAAASVSASAVGSGAGPAASGVVPVSRNYVATAAATPVAPPEFTTKSIAVSVT